MGKSIILRIFISLSDLISVDEAMVLILSSDFVVNESSGAHVKMIRAHVYFAEGLRIRGTIAHFKNVFTPYLFTQQ